MMLDNSSSMDIAASVQGINQLMTLSACDPSNAYYDNLKAPFLPPAQWNDPTQENYGNYQYLTSGGIAFDGTTAAGITLDPPVNGQVPVGPYPAYVPNEYPTGVLTNVQNKTTFQEEFWNPVTSATSSATGQTCQGVLPAQASGAYPLPGAPCASPAIGLTKKNGSIPTFQTRIRAAVRPTYGVWQDATAFNFVSMSSKCNQLHSRADGPEHECGRE